MKEEFIFVKTKSDISKLNINDIIYMEKELRKIKIITEKRVFCLYGKFNEVEKYLDGRFSHHHRSYVFNMDKIVEMEGQVVCMEGERQIPLGRETFRKTQRAFEAYMKEKEKEQEKT